jgi:hypothetical protein
LVSPKRKLNKIRVESIQRYFLLFFVFPRKILACGNISCCCWLLLVVFGFCSLILVVRSAPCLFWLSSLGPFAQIESLRAQVADVRAKLLAAEEALRQATAAWAAEKQELHAEMDERARQHKSGTQSLHHLE